jgi:hypothetical protein
VTQGRVPAHALLLSRESWNGLRCSSADIYHAMVFKHVQTPLPSPLSGASGVDDISVPFMWPHRIILNHHADPAFFRGYSAAARRGNEAFTKKISPSSGCSFRDHPENYGSFRSRTA